VYPLMLGLVETGRLAYEVSGIFYSGLFQMGVDCSKHVDASIILPWRNTDRVFTILSVMYMVIGIVSRVPAKITIFHKISLRSSRLYVGKGVLHLSSTQIAARIGGPSLSIQGEHASSNIQIEMTLTLVQGVLKIL